MTSARFAEEQDGGDAYSGSGATVRGGSCGHRGAHDQRAEAASALGRSIRQVQRLKRQVEASGVRGVIHGDQGREPLNKTPPAVRESVIGLAMGELE